MSDLEQDVERQITTQGVASYKVTDGEVFVFTVDTLHKLMQAAASNDSNRVILFVKHGALA